MSYDTLHRALVAHGVSPGLQNRLSLAKLSQYQDSLSGRTPRLDRSVIPWVACVCHTPRPSGTTKNRPGWDKVELFSWFTVMWLMCDIHTCMALYTARYYRLRHMVHTYVLSAYSVLSYVYPTCLSLATSVIRATGIYSVPTVVTRKRKTEAERFRYFRGENE